MEDFIKFSGIKIGKKDFSIPAAYIIEHSASGMVYVGSTNNLYERLKQHAGKLNRQTHHSKNLQELYNSNPKLNLMFKCTPTREEALDIEQRYLDKLANSGTLLNVATDARASGRGLAHMKEYFKDPAFRKKHAEKVASRLKDPEIRKKISVSLKRTLSTPEARQKRSDRNRAMWADPNHRAKVTATKSQAEYIDRISSTHKARWAKPEFRDKMKRVHSTEESKQKKREVSTALWKNPEFRTKIEASIKKRSTDLVYLEKMKQAAAKRKASGAQELSQQKATEATKKQVTINGITFESKSAAARHYGTSKETMHARLKHGYKDWKIEMPA